MLLILPFLLLAGVSGDKGGWTSLLESDERKDMETRNPGGKGGEKKQELEDGGWTSIREASEQADDLDQPPKQEKEGGREGKVDVKGGRRPSRCPEGRLLQQQARII